jgi:antibiotic biosynthesis monooxygenase (ABM) superfamily enzyme
MAVVTWLGIFPLVLVLSNTVGRLLAPTSPVLGVMAVTALVTVAMIWLVMPCLARLFARWLYPPAPGRAPNGPSLRPPAKPSTENS